MEDDLWDYLRVVTEAERVGTYTQDTLWET